MDTSIFLQGAIPDTVMTQCIRQYASDTAIGAYATFIGQVRADQVNGQAVTAIEYTAYAEMADGTMQDMAVAVRAKYGLLGLEVRHSLGLVAAGEICLFVLAAAGHRKAAMEACNEVVELLKKELPVWGRELLAGDGHQWKENT